MDHLPPNHFLNLPRPDVFVPTLAGTPDTSTLAAHDFDVDTRTGFMPPEPPLARLPAAWEPWETALESAITSRLRLADRPDLSEEDERKSESWRHSVREVSPEIFCPFSHGKSITNVYLAFPALPRGPEIYSVLPLCV